MKQCFAMAVQNEDHTHQIEFGLDSHFPKRKDGLDKAGSRIRYFVMADCAEQRDLDQLIESARRWAEVKGLIAPLSPANIPW